jgi:phenylacetyl-CoA:acceptor oxidoreductase subunit 1
MARYSLVVDLLRCVGCYGCQIACKMEHATPPAVTLARVETSEVGAWPNVSRIHLPLLCMHCEEPPCREVCPTGATQVNQSGVVYIDEGLCIGCKYCILACPYGARYFDEGGAGYFGAQGLTPFEQVAGREHRTGVVRKCDFCRHRVEAGLAKGLAPGVDREATPACVVNCMAKARYFGDLDDPESEVALLVTRGMAFQLGPEYGTMPKTYYLPAGRLEASTAAPAAVTPRKE